MRATALTGSGAALLGGSVVVGAAAVWADYRELVVLVVAALATLVVAMMLPRRRSRLSITRRFATKLIERGRELVVSLRIESDATYHALRLADRFDTSVSPIDIPRLRDGQVASVSYRAVARRRGVHRVGPVEELRSDPLGLVTRTIQHDVIDEVHVHPVIHWLGAPGNSPQLRTGHLHRRRTISDPDGDFRSLRAYVPGDDPRLIHWASTARIGQPVVRDFIEQRHTLRLVMLETLETSLSAALFEEAAEIAASLALDAWDSGLAIVSRTRHAESLGTVRPVRSRDELLTQYAVVERTSAAESVPVLQFLRGLPTIDQVFCITGSTSPLIRGALGSARVRPYVRVVQVTSDPARAPTLPVPSIAVRSAEEFVRHWRAGRLA